MIGLYSEFGKPVVQGGGYLYTVRNFDAYTHTIAALGGFWSANLSFAIREKLAEEWFDIGLGRQVNVKNHFNRTVWKGFVNNVTVTAGAQTFSHGPLFDIANRASCTYTPRVFPPNGPPVDGTATTTPLADDTASQAKYGIIEKGIAGGAVPDSLVVKMRDAYLAQNKLPKTSGDFSIAGTGQPLSVSLDLLGNIYWLTAYPYNNFVEAIITVYDKLLQVLNANTTVNPGAFSTDYLYIADNADPMEQMETKNRYAWDIVNEILSLGNDVNDLRRILGMYEDDKIHYNTIPTTIGYEYKLSWQRQRIIDYLTRTFIYPWDIRPGRWIYTSDWMLGRRMAVPTYEDSRCRFIESVQFTAPFTVGLQGSPYDELAQMLSKITYTGGIY